MFKKLFEKAAAKASLINVGYDLKRLSQALPRNPSAASKAIFTLVENITLAFANGAEESQVVRVLAENLTKDTPAYEIAVVVFALVRNQRNNNTAGVDKCDAVITRLFSETTGVSLDPSQIPWATKLAIATQAAKPTPPKPQPPRPSQTSRDEDIEAAEAFSRRVLERLSSGEILTDFDALRGDSNSAFKALLLDEVRRKKQSLELLGSYGAMSEDMQRMMRLIDHILETENSKTGEPYVRGSSEATQPQTPPAHRHPSTTDSSDDDDRYKPPGERRGARPNA